jgi:hypothetical protein
VEIWRLLNPTVGTANVVVTLSATTPVAAGATTYNGVNQTSPVRTFYSASGTGTKLGHGGRQRDGRPGHRCPGLARPAHRRPVGDLQTLNWSQANAFITGGSTREPGRRRW